ncbi:LytTR family DNA-binding domain-containing protein [Mucilaginibacter sp. UR6-1]|uniref:LytR/AlgR family response regulator transcription factor n=1 Tax=Mucilaginibacter sp. UR6-1 TaxID=1435643 RepID=UPI001E292453|nr:LytTR family DNA-binding domain-containing protein [Mucilaginibacter sp. UR6-1]MCC8411231.1 LytTR family DNA-binding domain-containing protein [Mucilaginibacter sp. UR6-1]
MLKCIAIDDEPLALTLISTYVSRIPTLQMLHTFENAIAGAEFLRNNEVDLLFIDINMPDITGIDLVHSLEKKPMVVFTTAYKNYAYEGFELEAIDYLLKPIDFNRFTKAVDKAVEYHGYKNNAGTPAHDENIYVYSEYRMVKITISEVEYLESMEDYVKIHLADGKVILTLMPMKKLLEKLPADKFRRIHRSFAVAVNKVRSIQGRKVFLKDTSLPISDSHADFIKEWAK